MFKLMDEGQLTIRSKYVVLFLYSGYLLIGIFHHEFWRDELQAWFLSSESKSLSQLWQNKAYEGHPSGWFLINYFINLVFRDFGFVVAFHLLVSASIAYILLWHIKINNFLKIVLLFGSLLGYEYAFFIRNYNVPVLCVLLFLMFYEKDKTQHILLFLTLGIGAQFNIFSTILCGSLGVMLLFEEVIPLKRISNFRFWVGFLIFTLLQGIFLLSVFPPKDNITPLMPINLSGAISSFSYFMEEFLIFGFYDFSNVFNKYFDFRKFDTLLQVINVCSFLYITVRLIHKKQTKILVFIMVFFSTLLMFFIVTSFQSSNSRHSGIFLVLLLCILSLSSPEKNAIFQHKWENRSLVFLCIFQLLIGLTFYSRLLNLPESHSKNASWFIKKHYPNAVIAGFKDYSLTPLAYYLDKKMISIATPRFESWVLWKKGACDLQLKMSAEEIKTATLKVKKQYPSSEIILLLDQDVDTTGMSTNPIKIFNSETTDYSHFEKYYLYKF